MTSATRHYWIAKRGEEPWKLFRRLPFTSCIFSRVRACMSRAYRVHVACTSRARDSKQPLCRSVRPSVRPSVGNNVWFIPFIWLSGITAPAQSHATVPAVNPALFHHENGLFPLTYPLTRIEVGNCFSYNRIRIAWPFFLTRFSKMSTCQRKNIYVP